MAKSFEKNKELNYLAIIKAVVFLVAVALAFVLLLVIVQRASETPTVSIPEQSETSIETSTEDSLPDTDTSLPPVVINPTVNYVPIELDTNAIHSGTTILVNGSNEFVFPSDEFAPTMADSKNSDYYVRDRSVCLRTEVTEKLNELMSEYRATKSKKNIMVYNGYLDRDAQKSYYDRAVNNYGKDKASMMQAKPGFADAHTGLSIDLRMYNNGEVSDFKGEDETLWIVENAHRYGFIVRYPDGKEMTTGLNASASKYRYVGLPHSVLIKNNELTLEEYIAKVKAYTYETSHWYCEFEGSTYEVYFAPASREAKTVVYVPGDKEYTISGNNVDGFIITIKY
ncbi:MAG: M15 family metallopeptidase [Clostridia bacterium]|nr:M15 family metallopeptidase [Clostridia bacterium]